MNYKKQSKAIPYFQKYQKIFVSAFEFALQIYRHYTTYLMLTRVLDCFTHFFHIIVIVLYGYKQISNEKIEMERKKTMD